MVVTEDAKSVLSVLFAHVKSWFQTLESKDEFEVSHSSFKKILLDNRKGLGEHTCIVVEKHVSNSTSKEIHYNFINHTTLGFTGDSIVEASFSALKRSCISVNSRNTIEYSGMGIVAQSENKSNGTKENKKMGVRYTLAVYYSSQNLTTCQNPILKVKFFILQASEYTSSLWGAIPAGF